MANQEQQNVQTIDAVTIPLIVAEYSSMREEIIKRLELEAQLVNLTLIVVGAFFSLGIQSSKLAVILLVYPLIAMFLASGWAYNDRRIRQIADYIRELETRVSGLGWGHFVKAARQRAGFRSFLGILSASGMFLTTQLVAVLIALLLVDFTTLEWILLAISVVAVIITIVIFRTLEAWK